MRTDRGVLTLLAVFAGVLVIGAVAMGGLMGGGMGPGMMYGYSPQALGAWSTGIVMGLGALMMLAFWGLVAVGVVLLIRAIAGRATPGADLDPLAILRRRYAAGEIDEATYQRIRRELTSTEAFPQPIHRAS